MTVFFLRHAEAEPTAGRDFDRRLTPDGKEQAARVGRFLKQAGYRFDVILASPVVRARKTAAIVARILGATVEEVPWLACGMTPSTCFAELGRQELDGNVLLVGHEPDFSAAIACLIGLKDSGSVKIRKASLTAITCPEPEAGSGQLQFLIPARLMET